MFNTLRSAPPLDLPFPVGHTCRRCGCYLKHEDFIGTYDTVVFYVQGYKCPACKDRFVLPRRAGDPRFVRDPKRKDPVLHKFDWRRLKVPQCSRRVTDAGYRGAGMIVKSLELMSSSGVMSSFGGRCFLQTAPSPPRHASSSRELTLSDVSSAQLRERERERRKYHPPNGIKSSSELKSSDILRKGGSEW